MDLTRTKMQSMATNAAKVGGYRLAPHDEPVEPLQTGGQHQSMIRWYAGLSAAGTCAGTALSATGWPIPPSRRRIQNQASGGLPAAGMRNGVTSGANRAGSMVRRAGVAVVVS